MAGIARADVHLIIAIFLGALLAVQAWDISDVIPFDQSWGAPPEGEEDSSGMARVIFDDWALPFEALSVLLLVALVGALAMAMRDSEEEA